MSALSNYLENALLTWIKGTDMPAAPAAVYVALFDGDPTDAASGGNEITNTIKGSTTRTAVAFGAVSDSGAAKQIANSADVTIVASAVAGADATHLGIFDAATAGNLLYHGALTASKTFNTGDEVKFAAGALILKAQ